MAGFRKDTQTPQQTTQQTTQAEAAKQTAFISPTDPRSNREVVADTASEAIGQEKEWQPGDDMPGFDVNEPVEVDSLHDQESGILPASTKVISSVKKASIKVMLIDNKIAQGERLDSTTLDINKWTTKSLHLELKIGEGGIDGAGAYAGKVLFCDLVLAINMVALKEAHARKTLAGQIQGKKVKPFNETWWTKESRYTTKQFYSAIGFDVTLPVPPADDNFLIRLVGCDVMHDITRVADSFRGDGEFRNEVKNFRAVEG